MGGMVLGVGWRLKREGAYVYLWLIHFVWQKKTQHCKAIILQLKISLKQNKQSYHRI